MRKEKYVGPPQRIVSLVLVIAFLSGCGGDLESTQLAKRTGSLSFTDVTSQVGLAAFRHDTGGFGEAWAPEINGAGGGFLDYNGDGWVDIVLVGGGAFRGRDREDTIRGLWLYKNNGDGTFSDRTEEAGLGEVRAYGQGISTADYDNDGDEDIFLSTIYENMLFRNEQGIFTEVTEAAGLAEESGWSTSAMFFDADRDGFVDLYVGDYVIWSPKEDIYCAFEGEKVFCTPEEYDGDPGHFYHNNGDGTFSDWTVRSGVRAGIEPGRDKVLGVAELDYNGDGWSDFVVTNDTERDLLFVNEGDGTFTEKGIISGIAFNKHGKPRAGMGVDAGIVDSSGQLSVFVGNFSDETVGVYRLMDGGFFLDRASASKVGHPSLRTLTFGIFLFDVDLDTDLDLFAANGHVQTHIEKFLEGVTFRQQSQLYLNRGDGVFEELAVDEGAMLNTLVARSASYADFDRDGDLDVLITENNGPVHLWRNEQQGGRFLRVQLEGRESNRNALGSRIEAWVDGLLMERRVRTGSSYLSQSEKAVTFGLGNASVVDSLRIFWPSGRVDQFEAVEGNQALRIIEGTGSLEPLP